MSEKLKQKVFDCLIVMLEKEGYTINEKTQNRLSLISSLVETLFPYAPNPEQVQTQEPEPEPQPEPNEVPEYDPRLDPINWKPFHMVFGDPQDGQELLNAIDRINSNYLIDLMENERWWRWVDYMEYPDRIKDWSKEQVLTGSSEIKRRLGEYIEKARQKALDEMAKRKKAK